MVNSNVLKLTRNMKDVLCAINLAFYLMHFVLSVLKTICQIKKMENVIKCGLIMNVKESACEFACPMMKDGNVVCDSECHHN